MKFVYALVLFCVVEMSQAYNKELMELYFNSHSAQAFNFGKDKDGSCQWGEYIPEVAASPQIKYSVGISKSLYADSISCGMCLRVRGDGEPVGKNQLTEEFLVIVNDVCTDCEEGSIDLGEEGDSHYNVHLQAVQCPVHESKIEYKFSGSDEWYIRLQVRNTRVPVSAVFVVRHGAEEAMEHTSDGFWELGNGPFEMPINVKIVGITDEAVDDAISAIENDRIIQGQNGAQFEHDWELP